MNEIKEIWLPLSERFYRVAYHILESKEDAEDAVQELYLKLIKTPYKFVSIKDPAAYGITILRNICIDLIRRREKRKSEELHEYMIADVSSPDKVAADKDKLRILVHEIDRLPQKQSMVLKMRTIE